MKISGERAWAIMGLGILAYEVFSEEDQLLSVAVDRFIVKHPIITRVCIALVALHLMNALPTRADPIHIIAVRANSYGLKTRTYKVERLNSKSSRLQQIPHRN